MIARRLILVEDTFELPGRGLVLVPGIIPEGDEAFRAGDAIELRRPDGKVETIQIGSLELPTPNPEHQVLVLLQGFVKEDVPVGTEVWSVDTHRTSC
jgi:hypothetical protein